MTQHVDGVPSFTVLPGGGLCTVRMGGFSFSFTRKDLISKPKGASAELLQSATAVAHEAFRLHDANRATRPSDGSLKNLAQRYPGAGLHIERTASPDD